LHCICSNIHAGAPSAVTSFDYEVLGSSENMTQVLVMFFWDLPANAQEFMLQIMNTSYSNTIRSLENNVIIPLPYGNYSATLCTINRCGQTCQDYSNIVIPEPQQRPEETECDCNTYRLCKSRISLKIHI
jgi:hypothetical protein